MACCPCLDCDAPEGYTHGAAGTSGLAMGPNDWPEGCINFAVNLVRPVQEGHRRKALFSVLSQTLVFDTLENASSYREFVTQVMCCACACSVLEMIASPAKRQNISQPDMNGASAIPPLH